MEILGIGIGVKKVVLLRSGAQATIFSQFKFHFRYYETVEDAEVEPTPANPVEVTEGMPPSVNTPAAVDRANLKRKSTGSGAEEPGGESAEGLGPGLASPNDSGPYATVIMLLSFWLTLNV